MRSDDEAEMGLVGRTEVRRWPEAGKKSAQRADLERTGQRSGPRTVRGYKSG